jgi:hypothetical protein
MNALIRVTGRRVQSRECSGDFAAVISSASWGGAVLQLDTVLLLNDNCRARRCDVSLIARIAVGQDPREHSAVVPSVPSRRLHDA